MPLALAYLRYNLKPTSPSNLAPMLLLVVTLIILIPHDYCNEHCKLMSKASALYQL